MTTKTRYQIAVFGFIFSMVIFVAFMLVPALQVSSHADFWQGLSSGLALGTFLAVLHYRGELRRERPVI